MDLKKEIALQYLKNPGFVKKLCLNNINIFQKLIIGHLVPEHFKEWNKIVNKYKFLLVLAPRDHGKTVFFANDYPLWRIIKNRNIRIKLTAKKQANAIKRLRFISHHLRQSLRRLSTLHKKVAHSKAC